MTYVSVGVRRVLPAFLWTRPLDPRFLSMPACPGLVTLAYVDGTTAVQWRVPVKVPVAKLAAGLVLLVAAFLIGPEPERLVVAGAVLLGLAAWAARDLLAPVRLAADSGGVTVVTGFGRRHRLAWPEVVRVRVDARRRSRLLEVDVGDTLYVFSAYDLGADLDEVAARLESLRTAGA